MKSKTFDKALLNTCGLATSVLVAAPIPTPPCAPAKAWSSAYSTVSCSWFCLIICSSSTSCLLILYSGSNKGNKNGIRGGGVGSGN